jgi:hypothetical protein
MYYIKINQYLEDELESIRNDPQGVAFLKLFLCYCKGNPFMFIYRKSQKNLPSNFALTNI